jgi:8-oxo-dGDP phosphatase
LPETDPIDATIERVSSRIVYQNPWMQLREDVIQRPDGSQGIYSYVDKPDFALIIPVERGGFHLVNQYRYPVSHRSWDPRAPSPIGRTATQQNSRCGNSPKKPAYARRTFTVLAISIRLQA